jgi:hypothetical protein
MSKEKTQLEYAKETAHFTRRISNNLQFFFYLVVISGVLGIMYNVVNAVNQIR